MRMKKDIGGVVLALLLAVGAAPAMAQIPPPDTLSGYGGVVFAGRVIDTYWTEPVVNAVVLIEATGQWALTDPEGEFRIPGVAPGFYHVVVSRIGFADLAQTVDIKGGEFIEVAMLPKPVVLDGIEVTIDALESRARELPYLVTAFTDVQLQVTGLDAASFLQTQPAINFVPCFDGQTRLNECVRARGPLPRRVRVFIDDMPTPSGITLMGEIPAREFYRIEFVRGCGMIRAYTKMFMENLAQHPRPLLPIIC